MQTDVRQQWESEGFVLVSGLFTDPETARIRDHFMEWNASERKEDFDGLDETGQDPLAQFPRIIHPNRQDSLSLDFLLDARIKEQLSNLLPEEPFAAQTMFYFKPAGAQPPRPTSPLLQPQPALIRTSARCARTCCRTRKRSTSGIEAMRQAAHSLPIQPTKCLYLLNITITLTDRVAMLVMHFGHTCPETPLALRDCPFGPSCPRPQSAS